MDYKNLSDKEFIRLYAEGEVNKNDLIKYIQTICDIKALYGELLEACNTYNKNELIFSPDLSEIVGETGMSDYDNLRYRRVCDARGIVEEILGLYKIEETQSTKPQQDQEGNQNATNIMEYRKKDILLFKYELIKFTNDIKTFLESSTPLINPLDLFNEMDKKTKVLLDYILDNDDMAMAMEILNIDMSPWDKIKDYVDLHPMGKGWALLRKIESVENNVETLRQLSINIKSTKPQQEQSNTTKRKGKSKREFKDLLIDDEDGKKLERIHKVLNESKGKDIPLIMLACMKKKWLSRLPTFTQVRDEFGNIGSKSNFNNYLKETKFKKIEIEAAIDRLDLD